MDAHRTLSADAFPLASSGELERVPIRAQIFGGFARCVDVGVCRCSHSKSNSRFDLALTATGIWAMLGASSLGCTRPRRYADGRASHAVRRRLDWPHPG